MLRLTDGKEYYVKADYHASIEAVVAGAKEGARQEVRRLEAELGKLV